MPVLSFDVWLAAWQVWCGALTWCPRCGPRGGTCAGRRSRARHSAAPRALEGKLDPGREAGAWLHSVRLHSAYDAAP